jgi:hypothetical protein
MERKRFEFKSRSVDAAKKRASGNKSDRITKEGYKIFTADEGENKLRIMPNTWDVDVKHYGFDVYTHYQVGPDKAQYLCLEKMRLNGGTCPICEQGYKPAKAEADAEPADNKDRKKQLKDYAYSLMPKQAAAMWIIDRKHEDIGPQIFLMTAKMDREFAALGVDPSDGSLISVESPSEGYDIIFTRTGKGLLTNYTGHQVARRASPLSTEHGDKWMLFIETNPLPNCFISFSAEYIDAVYHAKLPNKVDSDEGTDSVEETKTEQVEQASEENHGTSHEETSTEEEIVFTYEDLASQSTSDLANFAKENGIFTPKEVMLAGSNILNKLCNKLGITIPENKPAEAPANTPPSTGDTPNSGNPRAAYAERMKKIKEEALKA